MKKPKKTKIKLRKFEREKHNIMKKKKKQKTDKHTYQLARAHD